jgi:hypothetical protein
MWRPFDAAAETPLTRAVRKDDGRSGHVQGLAPDVARAAGGEADRFWAEARPRIVRVG